MPAARRRRAATTSRRAHSCRLFSFAGLPSTLLSAKNHCARRFPTDRDHLADALLRGIERLVILLKRSDDLAAVERYSPLRALAEINRRFDLPTQRPVCAGCR